MSATRKTSLPRMTGNPKTHSFTPKKVFIATTLRTTSPNIASVGPSTDFPTTVTSSSRKGTPLMISPRTLTILNKRMLTLMNDHFPHLGDDVLAALSDRIVGVVRDTFNPPGALGLADDVPEIDCEGKPLHIVTPAGPDPGIDKLAADTSTQTSSDQVDRPKVPPTRPDVRSMYRPDRGY